MGMDHANVGLSSRSELSTPRGARQGRFQLRFSPAAPWRMSLRWDGNGSPELARRRGSLPHRRRPDHYRPGRGNRMSRTLAAVAVGVAAAVLSACASVPSWTCGHCQRHFHTVVTHPRTDPSLQWHRHDEYSNPNHEHIVLGGPSPLTIWQPAQGIPHPAPDILWRPWRAVQDELRPQIILIGDEPPAW